MEQIPAEFERDRVCVFDRKVKHGKNPFKSLSCPKKFLNDLNGNSWDDSYRTQKRLTEIKESTESFFLFLRFEKYMTNEREKNILNFLNCKKRCFWKGTFGK